MLVCTTTLLWFQPEHACAFCRALPFRLRLTKLRFACFHVCVVDGVFESLQGGVAFHAATGLDEAAIPQVQANVRKRILPAFVARGHIEACDAKDMAERAASSSHGGGFSVEAGVRIEAADRAGLERLLRYCARPPFAMDRLKQRGADLVYRCGNGHARPMQSDKYSGELVLRPLELIRPPCEPGRGPVQRR